MRSSLGMAVKPPTLHESLDLLLRIPADIKLIREKEGIGLVALARSFRVSKEALWSWQKGHSLPKEPLTILCLTSWAKELGEREGGGNNTGGS